MPFKKLFSAPGSVVTLFYAIAGNQVAGLITLQLTTAKNLVFHLIISLSFEITARQKDWNKTDVPGAGYLFLYQLFAAVRFCQSIVGVITEQQE